MSTEAEIERLSSRRQSIWANGDGDPGEVDRINGRLAELYETRRHERAHVTPELRAAVVRLARVESELERLMTR